MSVLIKLEQDLLFCPKCNNANLHHGAIKTISRFCEDSDGIESTHDSQNNTVLTRPISKENIPYRRDSLTIEFWCEHCTTAVTDVYGNTRHVSDIKHTLSIYQHKGSTFMEWTN
jgi:hypothetical protein